MNKLKLSVLCLISLLCCALFAANEQDVIASVEYFYAQDGTLIGRAINGVRQNFEYDKRGQLLAVKDAAGRDLERYTYDPAGNRLSKTVNGVTTTYTYDEANQLKTSTVNGETTHYRYDAAGRLIQAGDKTYYYFGTNDKVTEVRQGDKVIAEFDYFMDGQIASAKYPDREESFTWDGLALVQRNEVSYINEPYVTGGNPILSSRDGVMFNDMLGSTLNIGRQPVSMTSFGESEDAAAFFTGKPMIPELGYAFLFRDYNPSQGKWTSSDPLGYPDGWNNSSYCGNKTITYCDSLGLFDVCGEIIFGHWIDGSGNDLLFYDDPQFTAYMKANTLLDKQIKEKIQQDALFRKTSGSVDIVFHAEIEDGYLTGYQMLHGTNSRVGDFSIMGTANIAYMERSNKIIDYDLRLTWNDIIDPNKNDLSDDLFEWVIRLVSESNPADYIIRISWKQKYRFSVLEE